VAVGAEIDKSEDEDEREGECEEVGDITEDGFHITFGLNNTKKVCKDQLRK
jgi:hypothetical protein